MYYTDSSVMVVRKSKNDKVDNDNNSAKSNTDTGTADTSNTDTDSARRSLNVVDDVPLSTLHSCDELRSKRTRVQGVAGTLLLDFDIVCTEKRVLEVTDNLLIMSNKPDLHLKGVHFHVRRKAALTFMVPTLTMEIMEGVSGHLFTIEPQGSVEMNADQWVPSPENGTEVSTGRYEKIRTMRDRLPYRASDRPPTTTIYSCEQFPFELNPVVGVLIIEGDIVCKEKRTLVVDERAYLFSYMDEVHLEGVHFIVEENAALGIAVATLHVEKLERARTSRREAEEGRGRGGGGRILHPERTGISFKLVLWRYSSLLAARNTIESNRGFLEGGCSIHRVVRIACHASELVDDFRILLVALVLLAALFNVCLFPDKTRS
ncbi:unnamed protein product [Ectocarpus sp. 4 AP-2014]